MIAHAQCTHERKTKHGKDRKGNQRWKCHRCGTTLTSDEQRPLGDMRVDLDAAALALKMLLEGMSIRACERITGLCRDTLCDLVLVAGENVERFMLESIKNVAAKEIQLDEIWEFSKMKAKTKERLFSTDPDAGDVWTWLAIDAETKLVLTHAVGLRDENTCEQFLTQLNEATTGPCQVTSDGLSLYRMRVPFYMGNRASFAQLIKTYSANPAETRYSPATIIGIDKIARFGQPDEDKVSTSFVERLNLSLRMHVRRYTRLTNAHSKSRRHHAAMTALFVGWYNYCRANMALGKGVSPAMAAKLTESVWSIQDLLRAAVR